MHTVLVHVIYTHVVISCVGIISEIEQRKNSNKFSICLPLFQLCSFNKKKVRAWSKKHENLIENSYSPADVLFGWCNVPELDDVAR